MDEKEPMRPEIRWVAGGLAWLITAWLWFRVIVPFLWGMSVEAAPIIGLIAIIGGATGLVYALYLLVRAIWDDLTTDTEDDFDGEDKGA